MMGKFTPFSMPLQIRRSLAMTNRILCPWDKRDMLNLNINIGSFFLFQITRLMQLVRAVSMLVFCSYG